MLDPQVVVNLLSQLGDGVRHSHNNSLTMSGRPTFICVLEANLALSCIPSARRWPLRLYPKVDRATVSLPQQAAWNWGCVSAVDARGQTIWIADAHRGGGKRFVVRADEKLTAFMEMEAAMRGCALPSSSRTCARNRNRNRSQSRS
jgi:hypothetical protein